MKTTNPQAGTITRTTATTSKFWNFSPQEQSDAELTIYGDIAAYESWWDDETTAKQFADELNALGDVEDITVRINSGGGDVFAAVAIFTRLKSHKAKITVVIDGWAASAATIIAMAGDVIKIPAAASFMIHDPALGLLGYYTGEDLQTFVNELQVCKDCIINAYMTKSKKSKDEIAELMSATSWFTGEQAVEQGFCDEVLFSDEDGKPIITDRTRYENMPKALTSGFTPPKDIAKPQNKTEKERTAMEIKTVEQLQAAYPALVKEVETAAATAERTRIKDIEERTLEGFEELAATAKFEKPETAADFAMSIIAAVKKQGADYLKNREKDITESGIDNVETLPAENITGGKRDAVDEAIERRKKAQGGK
jgi:ATP-dependent protease ClpP protease subunit